MEDLIKNNFISTKVFLNKYFYSNEKNPKILQEYKKKNKDSKQIINNFIKLNKNYNKSKEEFIELQNIFTKNYDIDTKKTNQKIIENTIKKDIKIYLMSFFDKNCSFIKYRNTNYNKNTKVVISNEIIFRIKKLKKFFGLKNMWKYNIKIISIYYFLNLNIDQKINYYLDIYQKIIKMFELYDEYNYLMDKYKFEIEQLIKIDIFDLYYEEIDSIISDDEEEDIIKDIINTIINKLED